MDQQFTQYVSFGNNKLAYHGMDRDYATRNMSAMGGNNLKSVRTRMGIKQPQIAAELGVSVAQVSRWESSKDNIPSYRLPAIAAAYKATIGELFDPPQAEMPRARGLPVIGMVAAGNWREAVQHSVDFMPSPDPSIPPRAYGLRVVGDSMDKYAEEGSTVIVDPDDRQLYPGRFFVVINGDGETTFKQFKSDPARLVPCSTNPAHAEIPMGEEHFEIVGRVIWRAARM